jgi:hypothetical protein
MKGTPKYFRIGSPERQRARQDAGKTSRKDAKTPRFWTRGEKVGSGRFALSRARIWPLITFWIKYSSNGRHAVISNSSVWFHHLGVFA